LGHTIFNNFNQLKVFLENMMQDYFEQFTNTSKISYDVLQELGDINNKVIQKIAELQVDFTATSIEAGLEQVKTLSSATNYKDFLDKASVYAYENSNKAIDYSKQAAAVLTESRAEVIEWFEKGFDKPAVKTRKTTKSSKASAK